MEQERLGCSSAAPRIAGKAPLPGARGEAFATLVTSDSYVVGAVVLASSLQSTGATRPIVCMVSPQVCLYLYMCPRFARDRARARVMSCASAPALAQVTRRRCG